MLYQNEDYIAYTKSIDGKEKYFIKFLCQVNQPEIEVSPDIFENYIHEFNKPIERKRNEKRRHLTDDGVNETVLLNQLSEQMLEAEKLSNFTAELSDALNDCTAVQQRRFELYHMQGYTLKEISEIEKCSIFAVKKSIALAEEKIKKFFLHEGLISPDF